VASLRQQSYLFDPIKKVFSQQVLLGHKYKYLRCKYKYYYQVQLVYYHDLLFKWTRTSFYNYTFFT